MKIPRRKRGREPHEPTDKTRAKALRMGKAGVRHSLIAVALDVCEKTLKKHYEKELVQARAAADTDVLESLYDMAMSKRCPAATIFWAKTRGGYKQDYDPDDCKPSAKSKTPKTDAQPKPIEGFVARLNDGAPNDGL